MKITQADSTIKLVSNVTEIRQVLTSKPVQYKFVTPTVPKLYLQNTGRKGDKGEVGAQGEGLDNFDGDPLAIYYLSRG